MKTYDFLWKGVIEELFEDFLRFFFPKDYRQFDLKRGYEFLDKELEKLFPEADNKQRHVDKLVKVWLKSGEDVWILVHIEVQGYHDGAFEYRMFVYYYRIHDRFKKEISALAILTDNDSNYRPKELKMGFGKTQLSYKFPVYKVLDQDFETLDASKNIFAVVIQTVLVALKKGNVSEEKLLELKLDLCRRLLKKEFPRQKIQLLLNFISFYVRLDKSELALNFEQNLDDLQNKRYNMTVRELLLHDAKMEGLEEGLGKGLEEGLEKGKLEGDYERLKRSARKMAAKGYSIFEISDNLDSDLVTIQKILDEWTQEQNATQAAIKTEETSEKIDNSDDTPIVDSDILNE